MGVNLEGDTLRYGSRAEVGGLLPASFLAVAMTTQKINRQ